MVLVSSTCISFVMGCIMGNPAFDLPEDTLGEDTRGDGDGDVTGDGDGDGDPKCGDGIHDIGEQCDLGPANDDFGECTRACQLAKCGDGFMQSVMGESCDLGPLNGNGSPCREDCEVNVCGDGYLGPGEACEINQRNCSQECTLPSCGNGFIDEQEQCDDGNDSNFDTCTNICTFPVCGDNITQPGEECDDGNAQNDDSCLADCASAKCGDGLIHQGVEECDTDNLAGMSCVDFDEIFGELKCNECEFDLSGCLVCLPLGGPCQNTDDCCQDGLVSICLNFTCVNL